MTRRSRLSIRSEKERRSRGMVCELTWRTVSNSYNLLGFEYTNCRCLLCKADLGFCEEGQRYLRNLFGASMYSPRFPINDLAKDIIRLLRPYSTLYFQRSFSFPDVFVGPSTRIPTYSCLTKFESAMQDSTRLAPSGCSFVSTICQVATFK